MTDENRPDNCPKCQLPLRKSGSGRLTQWIMVCTCDSTFAEPIVERLDICRDCGRHIAEGRPGTLTQWIFRADLCACRSPRPDSRWIARAPEHDLSTEPAEELEELTVGQTGFPSSRYAPLLLLGQGATGPVYLCRDRLLEKRVALKLLHSLTPELMIAFQREARATSQLNHPGIVRVLDFGITDGSHPYMVMDYIAGKNLETLLGSGNLDQSTTVSIFVEIAAALAYAHDRGVFHRDVKPSNIMISTSADGAMQAQIIDFGVGALKQEQLDCDEAQHRTVVGTPAYMSPELARGDPFDACSEVYTVGCVLFQALTGKPPFSGETALETLSLQAHEPPPTLSASGAHCSEAIETVVATCLRKSPRERYQSMEGLRLALAEIASQPDQRDATSNSPSRGIPGRRGLPPGQIAILTLLATAIAAFAWLARPAPERAPSNPHRTAPPRLTDVIDSIQTSGWHEERGFLGYTQWTAGSSATDEDFRKLASKRDVLRVSVGLTDNVTGEGFRYLAGRPLQSVEIRSTAITNRGLAEISRFKTLRTLRITFGPALTADGFQHMAALTELEHLELLYLSIPESAFDTISQMRRVHSISLYNSKNLPLAGVARLQNRVQQGLPGIEYLDLTGTGLDDRFLPVVAGMRALEEIRLANLHLSGHHLERLAELPSLSRLDLSSTPVTDDGLLKLTGCRQLTYLKLDRCKNISASGIRKLKRRLPALRINNSSQPGKDVLLRSLEPIEEPGSPEK